MMRIREMRVVMRQGFVAVRVAVLNRLVGVKVLVAFGQMQPDSDAHHEAEDARRVRHRAVERRRRNHRMHAGRVSEAVVRVEDLPSVRGWAFLNSLRGWLAAEMNSP